MSCIRDPGELDPNKEHTEGLASHELATCFIQGSRICATIIRSNQTIHSLGLSGVRRATSGFPKATIRRGYEV
jgi:hypothetical protein